jgi:biotin carboxylase
VPKLMVIRALGGISPQSFCPRLAELADLVVLHVPNLMEVDHEQELATIRQYGECIQVTHPDQVVPEALAYAEKNPVDGILTFSEWILLQTAEAAEKLGLPFHPVEAVHRMRNKVFQRRAFHDAGVPSAKFFEVNSLDDVDAALDVVPLPAVLKPQAGAGSILTFEATDREGLIAELRDALDLEGSTSMADEKEQGYILEEELIGTDWHGDPRYGDYASCESLLFQGEVHHINVTDRAPLAPPFRETGVIMPSTLDADKQQQIKDVAEQAAKAVGATDGGTHIEMKLTKDGPRIIEVNGRFGGSFPDLWHAASDFDAITQAGRVALGQRPDFDINFHRWVEHLIPPAPEGIIHEVRGLDEVGQIPGVIDVMRHNVKEQDSRVGIIDAMVTAIAVGDTPDELFEIQDKVFSAVEFVQDHR